MNEHTDAGFVIRKDLDHEENISDSIAYFRMAGASRADNFRSPDAYVFTLFEKCRGTHTIDFVTYQEQDQQMHVSFPRQIHSWDTRPGAIGHKLIISKYFAEKFLFDTHLVHSRINHCPVIALSDDAYRKLEEDFRKLEEELAAPEVAWRMVSLRAQLIGMSVHLLIDEKLREKKSADKFNPLLQRFYTLIDDNFLQERSVAFYACQLNVTSNYLNILCKQQSGHTAKAVIHQRFLLEAKRRLLGSGLSIKEIAYSLGFPDLPSFSRYIKTKTGFNPSKLQENTRGWLSN